MSIISSIVTDFVKSFSSNSSDVTKKTFAEKRDMVLERQEKQRKEVEKQTNISLFKTAAEVVSGNRRFGKKTSTVFGLRK